MNRLQKAYYEERDLAATIGMLDRDVQWIGTGEGEECNGIEAVSYTHLDVYKRQGYYSRQRAVRTLDAYRSAKVHACWGHDARRDADFTAEGPFRRDQPPANV